MPNSTVVIAADAGRLLGSLLDTGVSHDQVNRLCGADGHHLALRVAALLDPEPPDFSLDDFVRGVRRVASCTPESYLLLARGEGGCGTIGHLALGPVNRTDWRYWPLGRFHERMVLRLRDRAEPEACRAQILAPKLGRPFSAIAADGLVWSQLPANTRLFTLLVVGKRPTIII